MQGDGRGRPLCSVAGDGDRGPQLSGELNAFKLVSALGERPSLHITVLLRFLLAHHPPPSHPHLPSSRQRSPQPHCPCPRPLLHITTNEPLDPLSIHRIPDPYPVILRVSLHPSPVSGHTTPQIDLIGRMGGSQLGKRTDPHRSSHSLRTAPRESNPHTPSQVPVPRTGHWNITDL